jgi:hypothetical protein
MMLLPGWHHKRQKSSISAMARPVCCAIQAAVIAEDLLKF